MLKMRLQRIGRKNNPSYRVLVVDSRQGPKSGKFVDQIGSYDPKIDAAALDADKVHAWISKGVQVSPTVHNLLITKKIIEGKKINVLPKKTAPVKEEVAAETPAEPTEAEPAEEAAPSEEAPAAGETPAAEESEAVKA